MRARASGQKLQAKTRPSGQVGPGSGAVAAIKPTDRPRAAHGSGDGVASLASASLRLPGMRRIDRSAVATQVLKNQLDDRRVLDAGNNPQFPAAAPAEIDLDREYSFEVLRPSQRPLAYEPAAHFQSAWHD
jgi:hypothetical protein